MLAGGQRGADVVGVHLVRRGDIDRLHLRIGAKRHDVVIGPTAELGLERRAAFGAGGGGGDQFHARIGGEGRDHQHEAATQPDDA